ncbi:MAG: DNA polymerase I [Bacteroidetes bacterium ADurb.Bin139]|nr:MAG: DNA polymerase I [Bacteroidetes bacterium ADurb.Bin139]HOZ19441.1 DNA polymerase I [Bacteroidales bacterium]HPB77560.1 DNA polymerase I [Bacteroidales bacterium]HPK38722.1 DNA polymerase I [Bacteroidales bacterium]HQN81951.1 DNA polymerase I [Bacteroidales bacterium]
MKRIFMIDGHALLYRAYFAFINRPMINTKGVDTSAVYGFCRSLFDIILKEKPTHLFVAFDPGGKNFRHEAYPPYKANRPETPPVIKNSLPIVREFLESCRIPVLTIENAEADDVIGTLSKRAENEGFRVYMVTPDKDYGQLVSENILMYRPLSRGDGWEVLGTKEICEKYDIQDPEQVIDVLAIWGDASDNIPGVRGIGEVGAKKLVSRYGSVENVLDHLPELSSSLQEKLNQSRQTLFLSKDLVTIRTQLDIPWDEESFRIEAPDLVRLKELFREYEFHSLSRLLPKLEDLFCCNGNQAPDPVSAPLSPPDGFIPANSARMMEPIVKEALKKGKVGLAGNPQQLVLYTGDKAYLTTAALAAPLLENRNIPKCGFKLKELMLPLWRQNISLHGMLWDPELMHYLVNPERNHRPADLAIQYLNYFPADKPMENRNLFDAGQEDDPGIQNLVTEAFIAFHLKEPLQGVLRNDGTENLYSDLEMPLMEVLAAMEREGVKVDIRQLEEYGNELNSTALNIERQIREYAGDPALNVSSPKQVGIVLYDKLKVDDRSRKGKKQYTTDEETLGALAHRHPIIPLILEYRSLKKLLSSYIESLPLLVDPVTGRIHTTFNQTVTATGRLSSQKPNLQNIPIREERGREIRKFFVPRDQDHLLMSADYSQIELRILAHMSRDEDFIAAFNAGADIHTATAAKIFHCNQSEVTPEQRSKAKTANFGIIYGISAFGLASRLRIPRKEASDLIDGYYEHYPKVKEYLDSTIEGAKEKGYVSTMFNRRRYAPDIKAPNPMLRGLAERNAINAPIQGTAADIIKKAMVAVHRAILEKGLRSRMILQVHDELLFDVYSPEKEMMGQLVRSVMENITALSVPLSVDIGIGENWDEAH